MNKLNSLGIVAALLSLSACSNDKKLTANGDDAGPASAADREFLQCMAGVKKTCVVSEMNTAEKMGTPCASLTMLPVPLTDGTTYGPKTIKAGPYGGKTEWNVGAGTEFVNPVNMLESQCIPAGIESFKEPQSLNDEIENLRDLDYSLYTIFRPACMKEGETYPVITWANGTCGLTHGYAPLLSNVASHGFVVVASNSTWTGTGVTNMVQLRALDYAKSLNEDPDSIFYEKLDLDNIGAMGHSQGAGATAVASSDPRVKSIILWNGGTSNNKPFLDVSGDRDVNGTNTPDKMSTAVTAATKPGAWVYYHQVLETGGGSTGHLVLMEQPERVVDMAVAWWKYQLKGDQDAASAMFLDSDCTLCNRASEFEYGKNDLLE